MRRARHRAAGFTLIELMVVIAIIGIVGQIVLANIGALIPSTVLDSEAQKIMSEVEYLRSESQLQGKTYKLEFDLDAGRFRRILPPEMRVAYDQDEQELKEAALGWIPLDDRCKFAGFQLVGSAVVRDGRALLVIDPNGFTADQTITLQLKSEDLRDLVWTIQLRGLDRKARLVRASDGREALLVRTEEGSF